LHSRVSAERVFFLMCEMADFLVFGEKYFTLATVDKYLAEYRTEKMWETPDSFMDGKRVIVVHEEKIEEISVQYNRKQFPNWSERTSSVHNLMTDKAIPQLDEDKKSMEKQVRPDFKFLKCEFMREMDRSNLFFSKFKGPRCICKIDKDKGYAVFATHENFVFKIACKSQSTAILDVAVTDSRYGVTVIIADIMSLEGEDLTDLTFQDRIKIRDKLEIKIQCSLVYLCYASSESYFARRAFYNRLGMETAAAGCVVKEEGYDQSVRVWAMAEIFAVKANVDCEKREVTWMGRHDTSGDIIPFFTEKIGSRVIYHDRIYHMSRKIDQEDFDITDPPIGITCQDLSRKKAYDYAGRVSDDALTLANKMKLHSVLYYEMSLKDGDYERYVYKKYKKNNY